jgi:hypothetical protein
MPKAKLAGASTENRVGPNEGKGLSPKSKGVSFKANDVKIKSNPLMGAYDSRPRVGDNKPGATRYGIAGGTVIDGDKSRSSVSTSGPEPTKKKYNKY